MCDLHSQDDLQEPNSTRWSYESQTLQESNSTLEFSLHNKDDLQESNSTLECGLHCQGDLQVSNSIRWPTKWFYTGILQESNSILVCGINSKGVKFLFGIRST